MDAAALSKYSFFARIGAFGIDPSTRRGAANFLATSRGILATDGASLWITAQGEFSDPRSRPVELRRGVAHLIRNLERGRVVPLAVEYPFWNERAPEALARFGPSLHLADEPDRSTEEWNATLTARLTETMNALADEAISRDPNRFRTLVLGRAGVGGLYDRWRRVKAWSRGRTFDPAHGEDRR
jgi:1-acyl-sn-glycerol-3-phosphate acyltransferase